MWSALCAFPLACGMRALDMGVPVVLCLALFAITLSLEIAGLALPMIVLWAHLITRSDS